MTNEMRILTVRQPWAWAIIHGGKDVENRVRNLAGDYRGPVAIHAGLAIDKEAYESGVLGVAANRFDAPSLAKMPCGAIIGVVDLTDVHHSDRCGTTHYTNDHYDSDEHTFCSQWAEELDVYHLALANPRALATPIPFKGALGLRRLDADTIALMQKELA